MKRKNYNINVSYVRILNKIYLNVCKLNRNFDTLIDLAAKTKNQLKISGVCPSNSSELQTKKSEFQESQVEKQKNYRNSNF